MLPDYEFTFHFDSKGEKSGEQFYGDFTVKCILNNEEQVEVAMRTDRYSSGSKTLPSHVNLFNRTISELEMRIKRDKEGKLMAPSWWTESDGGRLLYDANIVYEVFTASIKGEEVWAARIKEKADKAEKLAEISPVKKEDKKN